MPSASPFSPDDPGKIQIADNGQRIKNADLGGAIQRTDTISNNMASTPANLDESRNANKSAAARTIDPNKANQNAQQLSYNPTKELGLRTQNTSTVQIENEKIARMKELLKKGDANVPKRSQTNTFSHNLPSIPSKQTSQEVAPGPDRSMSIGAASFKAAGFVNYDDASGTKKNTAGD